MMGDDKYLTDDDLAIMRTLAATNSDRRSQVIPEAAVEALARVLADEALFNADIEGYGWDAETDSSDHFMPRARKRATEYLEAAAPHMLGALLPAGRAIAGNEQLARKGSLMNRNHIRPAK